MTTLSKGVAFRAINFCFPRALMMPLLAALPVCAQINYTWDGSAGNWSDANRWTPNGVPGATDTANIGSGMVTLDSAATVGTFNLTGGTVNGTGTLTVSKEFHWSGGTLNHSDTLTLLAGGTGTISGSSTKTYGEGTFNNEGTLVWTGIGNIFFANGTWNNSGIFELQNDSFLDDVADAAPLVFNNSGTVRKTIATGTSTFNNVVFHNPAMGLVDLQSGSFTFTSGSVFNNAGTARVHTGTLTINAGGTGNGTFEAIAPGMVTFSSGTTTLTDGAQLIGTGLHRLASGTLTLQQNVGAQRLEITGGTVNGAGTLTVSNEFHWSGGTLNHSDTVTLLAGGSGTISGGGTKHYGAGTFNNEGLLVWTGSGNIFFASGIWNNSGIFELQNDSFLDDVTDPAPLVFNNSGTVRKTIATGTSTFNNVVFHNPALGLVDLQSGSFTFASGSVFNNAGTARVHAGTLTINAGGTGNGIFEAITPGTVVFSSGTMILTDGAQLIGTGVNRLASGTLTLQENVVAQRLEITGGTVNGTGTLTVSNEFHWSGGTLNHSNTLTLPAGGTGTISGSSTKTYGAGTFNNEGTLVWTGIGNIFFASGTWKNSGIFELQNDSFLDDVTDPAPLVFHNSGTVRKTTAAGTSTFSNVTLNNTGTVDIRSGTLSLNGNYAPTASGIHRFGIGGYEAGTDFGRLSVSGTLTLAGQLDLAVTNNFMPTNNATFAIVTAGSRSGTFSSVTGRNIGGGLYLNPTYPANGVILTVTDSTPSFSAGNFVLTNGQFQMRLTGVASETYRIDASTDFVNWTAISTNTLSGSAFLDFVDVDSPNFLYRFYRAVFLR